MYLSLSLEKMISLGSAYVIVPSLERTGPTRDKAKCKAKTRATGQGTDAELSEMALPEWASVALNGHPGFLFLLQVIPSEPCPVNRIEGTRSKKRKG